MNVYNESIYGHQKRLRWIFDNINISDEVLEVGCGTGYMISIPLKLSGYNIIGIDTDRSSIIYGKNIAKKSGLSPDFLKLSSLKEIKQKADAVIVSEVLEHLSEKEFEKFFSSIYDVLRPNGRLLVTVPNGYGWYEFEAWLWKKAGIASFFEYTRLNRTIMRLKTIMTGKAEEELVEKHPSTLDDSPHLQKYTLFSLTKKITNYGFCLLEAKGSVLFSGQISNLFFTGFNNIARLNNKLGGRFPRLASGFYLSFIKN
jgi:2-polyprenyl-3-methyl-5-hydroxy-6-metoxy-1,4-benzoquinol methylase